MKKLFLLFSIFATILTATAQSHKYVADNMQVRGSQVASLVFSAERTIESISVYPNPVVDELKIAFKSNHRSQVTVSLFNNIGKQVFTQETTVDPGNSVISIDVRSKSIEPGVYFIQLKSENQSFTRKLIVK